MKYKVTLKGKTYEVEVDQGEAMILDEYEEAIKKATTCEELDNAELAMLFKLMALTENEYSEDATPEEGKEIQERMNRLEIEAQKMQQKWGCEPEGEGDTDGE